MASRKRRFTASEAAQLVMESDSELSGLSSEEIDDDDERILFESDLISQSSQSDTTDESESSDENGEY